MAKKKKPKKDGHNNNNDSGGVADAELGTPLGSGGCSFKEPSARLAVVEAQAAQLHQAGNLEKALLLAMQQLALAKLCQEDPAMANDRELVLARSHLNLSSVYHDMGLGDQAFFHGHKAIEKMDLSKAGEERNNNMTISTLVAVAKAMILCGDPKCVNYLQRALVINHELHGLHHDSNFPIHEAFGDFYVNLGDSRLLHKETQSPKRKDKGKLHKVDDYTKALDEYSTAYEKVAGNGKKAVAFKKGGLKDARLGNMFGKVAKLLSKQGNEDEAAVVYEKAIACLENASPTNIYKLAQMHYELGITYHKNKKYVHSMEACKEAIKMLGKEKPDNRDHELLLLLIKKQQAISLYDNNEVDNAKAMFEDLLTLQRKEYGGSSVIIAETLKYLGDVYVALKDKAQAAKHYYRALHILRKQLGPIDKTVKQFEQYIKQLNLQQENH